MKKSHISLGAVIVIVVVVILLWQMRSVGTSAPLPPAATQPITAAQSSQARVPTSARPAAPGNSSAGVTYNPALANYLPNPNITPGDTLDVTPRDFCVPDYSKKVRDVPESVKSEAYRNYGITSHKAGQYEVDHLISLELGGSNSIRNLWPQSYTGQWNAHMKDALEDRLHELVCRGSLDMKTAQQAIATNWIAAYQKYVK